MIPANATRPSHGVREMNEPLRLSGTDMTNKDRLHELYATAAETHPARRTPSDHEGVVGRTRVTIGRRLVSLGSTVAGHRA